MDPSRTRRLNSLRMPGYDYARPGAYFVTFVTRHRVPMFGRVVVGRVGGDRGEGPSVALNEFGIVAQRLWTEIPRHHPHVAIDEFIVMPDHIHGILVLRACRPDAPRGSGARPGGADRPRPGAGTLGAIVGSYKSAVAREINRIRGTPGATVWHRNYHDRIIPSQRALRAIRRYIRANPAAASAH